MILLCTVVCTIHIYIYNIHIQRLKTVMVNKIELFGNLLDEPTNVEEPKIEKRKNYKEIL